MFREVNYSDETLDDDLDIHSLIEAIHERFAPYGIHDINYLNLRIKLLLEFFELDSQSGNENAPVFTQLLDGYGELPPLHIFPLEGAYEVPSTIDVECIGMTYKTYKEKIDQMQKDHFEIQRAYLTNLVLHSVPPRKRAAKVKLGVLVAKGLPEREPWIDPDDY